MTASSEWGQDNSGSFRTTHWSVVLAASQNESSGKQDALAKLCQAYCSKKEVPYADVGARLGMSAGAVKTAVCRLRQRYGQLLREEIARTVATLEEVEEEIRHLIAVMNPPRH